MVKAIKKENEFSLEFTEQEAQALGLNHKKEYLLAKARQGTWVMAEGAEITAVLQVDETEQRILGSIKKLELRDLVEGIFEKKLKPDELKKFGEMLKSGKVEKFKLNESYKKAVYRAKEQEKNQFENTEKPFQEYTLENDGFVIAKNENRAKELSNELRDRIKEGEIRGTRSFTGEFYIIKSDLLHSTEEKILTEMKKKKKADINELEKATGATKTLCKIAVEFLKEDGQMIEKTSEKYQYIE